MSRYLCIPSCPCQCTTRVPKQPIVCLCLLTITCVPIVSHLEFPSRAKYPMSRCLLCLCCPSRAYVAQHVVPLHGKLPMPWGPLCAKLPIVWYNSVPTMFVAWCHCVLSCPSRSAIVKLSIARCRIVPSCPCQGAMRTKFPIARCQCVPSFPSQRAKLPIARCHRVPRMSIARCHRVPMYPTACALCE